MIGLVALIGASAAIGLAAERRLGDRAEVAARRVMWLILWVLLPLIAFFQIAALELSAEVGAAIAYGYVALVVTAAVAAVTAMRLLHLPRKSAGALVLTAAFANTGYLGLPFAVALFGIGALPEAVVYDTLVSGPAFMTIAFAIAAAYGLGEHVSWRSRAGAFVRRNPPLWAAAAGFAAPAVLAPQWAVDGTQALVFAILPFGFFAVGVTLAAESRAQRTRLVRWITKPVAVAVALKLVVPPAVVVLLSAAVIHVPTPYVVQAGMASAINTLVVAHEYELDRGLVAGAIAWSTALVSCAGLIVAAL